MDFAPLFQRHKRVMLQFSAGKDSAACLWLLQPWWDKLDVVWCCQGNPYEETLEYMAHIENLVPRFLIVRGQQQAWVARHGHPVDVVPLVSTELGAVISRETPAAKLQAYTDCCRHNSWEPMQLVVIQGDYTCVIRGQKQQDCHKSPVTSGQVIDGVEYAFPLEGWSDEQVLDYVGPRLPHSYKRGIPSSLDCADCTAYVKDNGRRIADLEVTSPRDYETVVRVHKYLREQLTAHLIDLEA